MIKPQIQTIFPEDAPDPIGVCLKDTFGWKTYGLFSRLANRTQSAINIACHIARNYQEDTAVAIDGRIVVEYFGRNVK